MAKIKVRKIEFLWSENSFFNRRYGSRENNPPSWPDFLSASMMLVSMAQDMKSSLGYDKTAFRITWEDGQTYNGRFDLHKYGERQETPSGQIDLAEHVRSYIAFCGGIRKPSHMTEGQYAACLSWMVPKEEKRVAYREFLETHELE